MKSKLKEKPKDYPLTKHVRCIYHSRIVVTTPSGNRYDFQAGQGMTLPAHEVDYLTTLQRNQDSACCSGPGQPIKYFEEVQ